MNYYPFPAQLRSRYIPTREYGQATIVRGENALDFTSDFVPLVPLGEEASICWIMGERCFAVFTGKVYLSSSGLLRIVDIESSLLSSVRTVLAVNTNIPATVAVSEAAPEDETQRVPQHPAEVLFLSRDLVKLKAAGFVSANRTIFLSAEVDFLTLHNLPLLVKERIVLGKNDALLICEVLEGSQENFIALTAYSAKLEAAEKAEEKEME